MRARLRPLLVLVLAALVVRAFLFALRGDYLDWDEALYLLIARNVLEGHGIALNGFPHIALGPLIPLGTAAVTALSGLELLAAQRLLAIASGALLVLPVWYLLRIYAGARVALIGGLLLVGWPALIDVAPKLGPMWRHMYAGSEPVFLLATFAAFALGEAGLRDRRARRHVLSLLAGLSLGLAYLARPEALVVGGLYALVRVLPPYRSEKGRQLTLAFALAALGFCVAAGPYVWHMHRLSGSWMASGKLGPTRVTADLYQELVRDDGRMGPYLRSWWALNEGHSHLVNPYWGVDRSTPVAGRIAEYRAVLASQWQPQGTWLSGLLRRTRDYLESLWVLGLPLFAFFALAGLIRPKVELTLRFPPFVMAGLLASLLTAWQVFVLPRFFLYLVPALALWAARGVIAVSDLKPLERYPAADRILALLLVLAGLALAGQRALGREASGLRQAGLEDRLAAERLAAAVPESEPLMSWHPRLGYFAWRDWRVLPVAELDATIHYAALSGVRYLLLAKAGYSPLALEAPYVVVVIDPEVMTAYRSRVTAPGDPGHRHPAATLVPTEPLAGFPTGHVRAADGQTGLPDGE